MSERGEKSRNENSIAVHSGDPHLLGCASVDSPGGDYFRRFVFIVHIGSRVILLRVMRRTARTLTLFGAGMALALAASAAGAKNSTQPAAVIYEGKATQLSAARVVPVADAPADLWLTLGDLTRATGFEVKPQGVCRAEVCIPLPAKRESDFLQKERGVTWFNLSAFARLLHQPVAYDAALAAWDFGPRLESQNHFVDSLEAPNFTLPDVNGKLHSLADFRGKKVLLLTWASW